MLVKQLHWTFTLHYLQKKKVIKCRSVTSHFEKLRALKFFFKCVQFGTNSALFEIFFQSAFICSILTHFEKNPENYVLHGWLYISCLEISNISIIPHATSCGGYNVYDPSVRQSFSQSFFSCQHNSSESTKQNFVKLCIYEGRNV